MQRALARVPGSEYVSRWSFNLFSFLAHDDSCRKKLIAYGILEMMQVALQQHCGDEGVAEWCLRTMHALSHLQGSLVKMKSAGLCETTGILSLFSCCIVETHFFSCFSPSVSTSPSLPPSLLIHTKPLIRSLSHNFSLSLLFLQ